MFLAAKQKNKKSKAGHKKVKQKKMKRKWPGTGDKGSRALLKNSGELEATSSFLESGRRPDGYPIWCRQDDLDLQKDDDDTKNALVKKFGAQNVARRIEFRKK